MSRRIRLSNKRDKGTKREEISVPVAMTCPRTIAESNPDRGILRLQLRMTSDLFPPKLIHIHQRFYMRGELMTRFGINIQHQCYARCKS